MHAAIKKFIKFELHNYTENLQRLENISPADLISTKHLDWLLAVTQSIEMTLAHMPADIKAYIQTKYFCPHFVSKTELAATLSVSKRTIDYWDNIALTQIAKNLGLVNFDIKL